MASASTPSVNEPTRVSSGINGVAIVSVHPKKTCLKKMIMIIIMNNTARNNCFWWALEIDFRHETKARKVMVDFKFDDLLQVSLHREPPEVGLVKKLTGSLY